MKTELTIEQSARLIEIGVDASLASKCQNTKTSENPIFTLSDLLSILPKRIRVYFFNAHINKDGAEASYVSETSWLACYTAPELIDVLYLLLVWVVENGYIK